MNRRFRSRHSGRAGDKLARPGIQVEGSLDASLRENDEFGTTSGRVCFVVTRSIVGA